MSLHSYSRVWLHLVWATLERRPLLDKAAAAKLSVFLQDYARQKEVYVKINYVNADHVHALVDLPTHLCIEELMQLFKGASSRWVNEQNLLPEKFGWGRGYGVFSVSESVVPEVCAYIAKQEEHHRKKNFVDELRQFIERHGMQWRLEKEQNC